MTLEELARLVREMRGHQKDYFKTRSGASLELSKDREKLVDAAIADILDPSLFPKERIAGRPERMPPGSGGES